MKKRTALALILSMLLIPNIYGQTGKRYSQESAVSFNNEDRLVVFFDLKSSYATDEPLRTAGSIDAYGEKDGESRVHRVIADGTDGTYYGYDIVIRSAASGKLLVTVEPFSKHFESANILTGISNDGVPQLELGPFIQGPSSYPAAAHSDHGGNFELEVQVKSHMTIKLVDRVRVATMRSK